MIGFYYLMHRDDAVAILAIDPEEGALVKFKPICMELMPFLGNANKQLMSLWLKNRSIPGTREDLDELLSHAGCGSKEEYLFKNLAVSINDTYWLRPEGVSLGWDDINPHKFYKGQILYIHNDSSCDPSATLGGQMSKYIDMSIEPSCIVKTGTHFYGLQCYNEVIATRMHEKQGRFPFVPYKAQGHYGVETVTCSSPLFTSEEIEFIPAYEVMKSKKQPNDQSNYDFYVDLCMELGIEDARSFLDYMTLTDFVITNMDRHLSNFGILRNARSLEVIGMAPIFDSGNSMFYNIMNVPRTLDRKEILKIEITSFHKSEEKMIAHISDRLIADPSQFLQAEDIGQYFMNVQVPGKVVDAIVKNYERKLELVAEFQRGEHIAVYFEGGKS